jgi:hypothetical protein
LKHIRSHLVRVAAVGGLSVLSAATAEAALIGATPYTNLLAAATNTSFGREGSPGVWSLIRPLSGAIDGGVGGYSVSDATLQEPQANNGPAFMQWALPAGTFTANTFLTMQANTYPTFTGSAPYQLALDSGPGGTLVDVAGHIDAGLAGTSPFVITNPAAPVTASRARIDFEQGVITEGYAWAVMHEVIALEDRLTRVPIVGGSAPNTLGGYPVTQAFDNQETFGWAADNGAIGQTLTLNLGEPTDLDAIWITGVDGRPEQFTISFNGVPTVLGVEWSGNDNYALLKLDATAQDVTSITLTFTGESTLHYIGEVIPFTIVPVPEPASGAALGAAALGVLSLRRRRQ